MPLGKNPVITEGIETAQIEKGLVIGKFMPPTLGHLYLIDFAKASCKNLTIMVCSLPDEPISGELRYQWIKTLYPDCHVVHHPIVIAQAPKTTSADPDGANDIAFYETWRDSIHRFCGDDFDALFASETYGFRVADCLNVKFIPVDISRALVSISATKVRENPFANWDYIPPIVRPFFLKRIAIVGPESAGKSTLTKKLAEFFHTSYANEYARDYLDACEAQFPNYISNHMSIKDISTIARGQLAQVKARESQANKIFFCDTELRTTKYWSNYYFQACPKWINDAADKEMFDLYLLIDPRGIEQFYQPDHQRPMPEIKERIAFFEWWQKELDAYHLPYEVITGPIWEDRFLQATKAIYKHIQELKPKESIPLKTIGFFSANDHAEAKNDSNPCSENSFHGFCG